MIGRQVIRDLAWVDPLAVATGMARRDGALCLLSDPSRPGARSFVAAEPEWTIVERADEGGLFQPLRAPGAAATVALAAYDAGARPATGERGSSWPDLIVARYGAWLVFDHDEGVVSAIGGGVDEREATKVTGRATAWLGEAVIAPVPEPPAETMTAERPPDVYEDAVAHVTGRIAAGDLFQANIARAWSGVLKPDADPFAVFQRLAAQAAAPYAAFWRMGERALVSNSPEMFLTLEAAGGCVTTRPIKGTRARGADPVADAAARAALVASAKDRAENLMIVDLMRNDLARVCGPGTVKAEALFEVETLPTVHHLVSTVSGRLAEGADAADLLEAAFPPGSITGAPKHQAMRLIAQHEPPRGPWCGALIVIEPSGDLTSSVLIRTAGFERREGRWTFRTLAGAGIVADSDPAGELAETEAKISALRRALIG